MFLQRMKDASMQFCQTIWTCQKVWIKAFTKQFNIRGSPSGTSVELPGPLPTVWAVGHRVCSALQQEFLPRVSTSSGSYEKHNIFLSAYKPTAADAPDHKKRVCNCKQSPFPCFEQPNNGKYLLLNEKNIWAADPDFNSNSAGS